MAEKSICRIGVFYDGSFFAHAQHYYYHEKKVGWLSFVPFHRLIQDFVRGKEQGFLHYNVVYAGWYQGMFTTKDATLQQLRGHRILYHDLMHAGIAPKFHPVSVKRREKGVDVGMAVDVLQVALGGKIDVATLVTGDADFVPLVRALMKEGIRVLAAYFAFTDKDGRKSFVNERLLKACNYELNVTELERDKDYGNDFRALFKKPSKTPNAQRKE